MGCRGVSDGKRWIDAAPTRDVAGAGGFEPPPSALTVQRPTGWTTPQKDANLITMCKALSNHCLVFDVFLNIKPAPEPNF